MNNLKSVGPHSRDNLIRVNFDRLGSMNLAHVCSLPEGDVLRDALCAGLTPARAGITEWEGALDGRAIYLGWDWIELVDGSIAALRLVAPRSNLRIIDSLGYDIIGELEEQILWQVLDEQGWHASVRAALNALPGSPSGIDRPPQRLQ